MSAAWPRTVLHVDMDAFFASVEQRDDPSLAGLPVIVGHPGARGVVAAASYEVRRYGVRSAMTMREALRRCPDARVVKPRMARYSEVSRQVFAIFGEFTPEIEGLSVDEAFLDVTASARLHGDGERIARAIKTAVRERTRLTASVGVATNKLVAKIASDLHKPDGLCVVPPERINAVLDPLPVTRLPGLGRKKGEAVIAAGIATLGELRQASDARLWPLFGHDTRRMRDRAAGRDDRPVEPDREDVQISGEETFGTDIADDGRLLAALLKQCDRVGERLRRAGRDASVVTIKLREPDFHTMTRQRSFSPPTHEGARLAEVVTALFRAWRAGHPGRPLRLVGVAAAGLVVAQPDLFAAPPAPLPAPAPTGDPTGEPAAPLPAGRDAGVAPGLDATLDDIRRRFGAGAVQRAGNLSRDSK